MHGEDARDRNCERKREKGRRNVLKDLIPQRSDK